ncbi:MAG: DUF2249 domain-containing protein [Streptosporangiaceae bacterium]
MGYGPAVSARSGRDRLGGRAAHAGRGGPGAAPSRTRIPRTAARRFGQVAPGRGFVLVNDHDPLSLRYQFEAQYPGRFTWDYVEAGPGIWRVRIGRAGA